jgi:putative ABC transport system permease protein
MGVRSALGATSRNLVSLVLRQGLTRSALPGALLSSRDLATLLFGVSPVDAVTHLAVVDMLIGVSVIACGIPASRYFFPAASAFAFDV